MEGRRPVVDTVQEEYLELSPETRQQGADGACQQEAYEPLDINAGQATSVDVHVQEEYMNLGSVADTPNNNADDFEQENYENYEPPSRNNDASNTNDDEQEDYENYDPNVSHVNKKSASRDDDDDDDDLEDYENVPSPRHVQEEEPTYENASAYRIA